jgi:hypothetical protein
MGFRSAADGITKQGKTKGKNLGNDGAHVGIEKGPKHAGSKGGKSNADMKKMGRGLAKIAAQKKG